MSLRLIVALAALGFASVNASASSTEVAAHAVLERVLGSGAAAQITLTLRSPATNPDGSALEEFVVSGSEGHIVVEGTSASALTQGAGWYLKYVAHADLMLHGKNPSLPALLPAPNAPIHASASVPHRYAFNDTNDAYTDANLGWEDWENELDLMALHGINEVYVTVGTDAVYYQLLQRYGYSDDEARRWIPDPSHQPWWVMQNLSGSDPPISPSLLAKRAQLGRRIADRARELGITPVFPGYWGTVPVDFAVRNPGADVIGQDTWVGYQRPGWLNPDTPLFKQVAADYYAISDALLGASSMYKMDPLHEGGVLGHADLARSASAIEAALHAAHPGATWVILGWLANPLPALLDGIADKSHALILAAEADRYPAWDSGQRWNSIPYAFGSIYNFGGRAILGANAATIVDRWFSDRVSAGARLRGVAILPEAWNANPAVAELMSELPWHAERFDLAAWLGDYATGRYGSSDAHALDAWALLAQSVYAMPPDGNSEGQDSLFNAEPSLTALSASCCSDHMRYSAVTLERAWRELIAAAPAIRHNAGYVFDLADITRQVIVNRARPLLPLIRGAFEHKDAARFKQLTDRWMELMDLADRVEATDPALLLGPRLVNAKANATSADEQSQLAHAALALMINWGTRAGFEAGLRNYANRDWNCLTGTFYRNRWRMFFDGLESELAGSVAPPIDWYAVGEQFAAADHSDCATIASGDVVAMAQQASASLAAGPEASSVPDAWMSFSRNDAIFDVDSDGAYVIDSAGADLWQNVNEFGALYQREALGDGMSATVRVASMRSDGDRPWARSGIVVASNLVDARPAGFANIAITPAHGCVFSWASDAASGLTTFIESTALAAPRWVRMTRVGNTYVASCSEDGTRWTVVGGASPGGLGDRADVGMFASAANGFDSDRLIARFADWSLRADAPAQDRALAIEYVHAQFGHYFLTTLPDEIAKLDSGYFAGWSRTGEAFYVFTQPGAGRVPVCRFFTTAFPPTSSHFYAPRGLGCEPALANADWQFEGEVFYTPLPDANGACPDGTSPVFRLYNDGLGGAPNHRFTTRATLRAQMLAQGYVAEGSGIGVGMCAAQ
ncbi:MAG TPA: alpha-N-acetylglucosaminidase [Casimicrobiaceae bacterium]|nr:alpha-N-acetylglucosaminidase [Casimicrobiaceae bacterium]